MPAVGMTRPPPLLNEFPVFWFSVQEGSTTSYDAVSALEEENPGLVIHSAKGRDGSSVLIPRDENSYQTLNALVALKLVKLNPFTRLPRGS